MVDQPHIVFMNMSATGHMNPTLPVVAELVARGCKVTYFVEATMRDVVEAAGASWKPFRYANCDFTGILRNPSDFKSLAAADLAEAGVPEGTLLESYKFPVSLVFNAQLVLPNLVEDLQALDPHVSAIVYEPFLACARVAAYALGIPGISLFTMPGPGVISVDEGLMANWEGLPWVQKPREWIKMRYGLDVFKNGALMEFYSPDQNLVTTISELYTPPLRKYQIERYGHFPFRCVGALIDPKVKRIENAGDGFSAPILSGDPSDTHQEELSTSSTSDKLPLDRIRDAQAADRCVVFISLGTVVTERMWDLPLGMSSRDNDGRPDGTRSIKEYTGKEFCQFVYKTCFEAIGNDPNILAIVSMGTHGEEALCGLPPVPQNVVLMKSVPQIDLLPLCDAFVTHGGANSMHEGLVVGIPLVVVPCFGDQVWNADTVARCGAGFSFRHPLRTLSVEAVRSALQELLRPDASESDGIVCIGPNTYRAAARRLADQLACAGGVSGAVDAILEAARRNTEEAALEGKEVQSTQKQTSTGELESGSLLQRSAWNIR